MKHATIHRRATSLGALAAAIALLVPASLSAQRGAGGAGARGGMFNTPAMMLWTQLDENYEEFSGQLALTEEQKESIAGLLTDLREKNKEGLEEYGGIRASMGNRGGGGGGGNRGGNRQAMQATFQRLRTLLQELGPVFEKLHTDVGELLTEDQNKKLAELLQPRRPGG